MNNTKALTGDIYMTFTKVKRTIYLLCKRTCDIIVSLIGLVLLIPTTLIVKIAYICTGDFHSIFFIQDRIGKNGKNFKFYKFRSMVPNADEILFKALSENEKYIKEIQVEGRKRTYRITDKGRRAYEEELTRLRRCVAAAEGGNSHV